MAWNPQEYVNRWNGKGLDLDGVASVQCVDAFKQCLKDIGYPNPTRPIGGSGGAKEIWYRREALGYSQYFDFVQTMKFGDWCIWDSALGGGYGHVAMYVGDNGNGTGRFFGQNQSYANSPFDTVNISYAHSLGALRVKTQYCSTSYDSSKLIAEKGRAYFRNSTPIIIRKDSPTGPKVGQFVNGEIQDYTEKYIGNGHRYISWLDPVVGNARCFAAVSATEQRPAEGTDEQWATFGPYGGAEKPQPKPEEPKPQPKPEFSDNPNDDNFLENSNMENEIFEPKSKLFEKYGIKVIPKIVPKDLMPHKCPFTIDKQFTITHNAGTSGNPSAETLSDSMDNTTEERSWHFSVDESTIVQNIPLNRNSWAAGDYSSGWNSKNGINIEICRDMEGENADKFSMAERNGAILVAELMYQNGWTKDTIRKHQDFANKYCPHKTLDLGWDRYVDMVISFLNEAYCDDKPQEQDKEEIDYGLVNKLIKLIINLLNKIIKIFK